MVAALQLRVGSKNLLVGSNFTKDPAHRDAQRNERCQSNCERRHPRARRRLRNLAFVPCSYEGLIELDDEIQLYLEKTEGKLPT